MRRAVIRVPIPEPGELGVASMVGVAGFALAFAAYMLGRNRGEAWGWMRGHDAGLETGRTVERRWPGLGEP